MRVGAHPASRKVSVRLRLCVLTAAVLAVLWASLLLIPGPQPATQSVSVYIDGFTNVPPYPRMAWLVITNRSDSNLRLWAWGTFVGPRPSNPNNKRSLEERG